MRIELLSRSTRSIPIGDAITGAVAALEPPWMMFVVRSRHGCGRQPAAVTLASQSMVWPKSQASVRPWLAAR